MLSSLKRKMVLISHASFIFDSMKLAATHVGRGIDYMAGWQTWFPREKQIRIQTWWQQELSVTKSIPKRKNKNSRLSTGCSPYKVLEDFFNNAAHAYTPVPVCMIVLFFSSPNCCRSPPPLISSLIWVTPTYSQAALSFLFLWKS